jgi:hypothetical protein
MFLSLKLLLRQSHEVSKEERDDCVLASSSPSPSALACEEHFETLFSKITVIW